MCLIQPSEELFLQAWKEAIEEGAKLAGPRFAQLFGPKTLDTAQSKWDLRPLLTKVKGAMGVYSTGEKMYLAAMYSFFNWDDGQELLAKYCDPGNIAQILTRLEHPQRVAILKLAMTWPGW